MKGKLDEKITYNLIVPIDFSVTQLEEDELKSIAKIFTSMEEAKKAHDVMDDEEKAKFKVIGLSFSMYETYESDDES